MLSGRSHFNGGLEWLEMIFDFFFYVLSSLQLSFLCYPRFFHFVKKISSSSSRSAVNLFIIIIIIIIMPFFFVLTKKKKTFPSFRARIHLLRSQPTQSSNHFPIFFFSTMHNLSEIFLFRLQVFFFPLYLSFLFFQVFSFVIYDFFYLFAFVVFFLYPILLLYLIPPIFIITKRKRTTATVFRRKANFFI